MIHTSKQESLRTGAENRLAMARGIMPVLVLLATGMILASLVPVGVRANPAISQLNHSPKYPWVNQTDPPSGDKINLTAVVTDSLPLTDVTIYYCSLPGGVCRFAPMDGPNASYGYNKTVYGYPDSTGMDYYVVATNNAAQQTTSETHYIQFAQYINVTATSDKSTAYPGETFNITSGALYWSNASAPVEYSNVNITLQGTSQYWTGTTNATGNFTIQLDAPATVEGYTYRVTISNRTVSGWAETYLTVLTEPLPDLRVTPSDVLLGGGTNPLRDTALYANVTIRNTGTLGATFYVLITLANGGTTQTLKNVSVTLGPGNQTSVNVTWNALAGIQYLNITLDPGNFVREASETNNIVGVILIGREPPVVDGTAVDFTPYIVGAVLIFPAVIVVAILLMRKRKPSQP